LSGSGTGTETFPKPKPAPEPEPQQIITGTVPQHVLIGPVLQPCEMAYYI
jgi:hypothetical protein